MLEIALHQELILKIMTHTDKNEVARPQKILQGKSADYEWEYDYIYTYQLDKITDKEGHAVAYSPYIVDFIETINGFASKILEDEKIYGLNWNEGTEGYRARIVQETKKTGKLDLEGKEVKKTTFSLEIEVVGKGKKIYLSKLDCKIITSKFQKVYSKCLPCGFNIELKNELSKGDF